MPPCTVVQLPQDRNKVCEVKRSYWSFRLFQPFQPFQKLYVGVPNEWPWPLTRFDDINNTWNHVLMELDSIIRDINPEIEYQCQDEEQISVPCVEPELLLTGREVGNSIPLSPTIWLKCSYSKSRCIVEKAVAGLNWPARHRLENRIEVCLGSPILVTNQSVPIPDQLKFQKGFPLCRGYHLHLNSQRPDKAASACGLLCSIGVIDGKALKHHGICRIGGILSIKDGSGETKTVGITAAHGLLDRFLTAELRGPSLKNFKTPTLAQKLRLSCHSTSMSAMPTTTAAIGKISSQDANKVKWEPVEGIHSINWLGGGWKAATGFQFPFQVPEPKRLAPDADFALLELPSEVSNTYNVNLTTREVTHLLMESQVSSGPVDVIIAKDHVVQAKLLSSPSNLYLRGIRFPTAKIQLDRPLGGYDLSHRRYTADHGHS